MFTLPRPADSNVIITVKFKRKLQYRHHVYFESVIPNFILRLLQYLKSNNLLYHNTQIDVGNIPNVLINEKSLESLSISVLNYINIDDEIPIIVEKSVEEVESSNHCISNNFPIPVLLENCDDYQESN